MLERFFGSSSSSALIEGAFAEVTRMLDQAEKMFEHAISVLLDHQKLEVDLETLDDVVDEGERTVRRTVLEHLALDPSRDLVPSLLLLSVVQDAERVGDFARGLVEVVPLAKSQRTGQYADELRAAAARVRPMFADSRKAIQSDDAALAESVVVGAQENKRLLIAYTAKVADSDLTADMAVVYSSAARILRRMSSHLSNICSTVSQPYDRIRHDDETV